MNNKIIKYYLLGVIVLSMYLCITSCKKLVDVNGSYTSLNYDNVYTNDATAVGVLTGIYSTLSRENSTGYFSVFTPTNVSMYCGLSADEFLLYKTGDLSYNAYFTNNLSSNNLINDTHWKSFYNFIYATNAAIEGLTGNNHISKNIAEQLLGEAKFFRAFSYFYLVNLFGDVPLVLSTNPNVNAYLPRTNQVDVYKQIIQDLKDAELLLSSEYLNGTVNNSSSERVRPTRWAACALLARVYLFSKDYANAVDEATKVISQSSKFQLVPLSDVFLKNSLEAIWQLQSVSNGNYSNTGDGSTFILTNGPNTFDHPVYLSHHLVDNFEVGDSRRDNWIDSSIADNVVYYYPFKYKLDGQSTQNFEYVMMMRLGEQYLIRAEARTQVGNLEGAHEDLNKIRNRAGLLPKAGLTKEELLSAILHERQFELFTEWGNRWFDLKRTNSINSVMSIITPEKGGTWSPNWQVYPILSSELQADHNLQQNEGY